MARNSKSQQEQRLLELLNSPVNKNKCGECKDHNPTWASWNLGVFLCGRCASAHRSLGKDISRVKSLSMENWSSQELSVLGKIGNKRNNKFWNEKNVPFPYDPDDKDSLIMWLRDKYTGRYRYGAVTDADYNLEDSWGAGTDDYGLDKSRRSSGGSNGLGRRMSSALGLNYVGQTRRQSQLASRAQNDDSYDDFSGMTKSMRRGIERNNPRNYENDYDNDYNDNYGGSRNGSAHSRYSSPSHSSSRPGSAASRPMRLTYRRPTESDYRKFGDQSRKMKFDMGYEDEDVNVEALSLARGNIDRAVEIIKQSGPKPADYSRSTSARNNASSSSASSKAVPSLPQRKEAAGSIFDSTKAGGFNWLDDSVAPTDASDKDNQIYQYVDPNTGSVYYIDANGQQYVDPSQLQTAPQQQMMDPFQLQQQPMAQTVMQTGFPQQSMATGFSQQAMATGVNVPASQLSMNQLAQQQQLQQQQLQQQQLQQQQLQQQQLQQQQLQQQQLQQQQLQQQQIYQPNFYNGY